MKGTAAINIFTGIVIVYLIWKLTDILQMNVLSNILGGFISVGVFALIVVFQQEIRKLLLTVGSTNLANPKNFRRYWNILTNNEYRSKSEAKIVVNACAELSAQNIGALIVFERNTSLDIFKESCIKLINKIRRSFNPLHEALPLAFLLLHYFLYALLDMIYLHTSIKFIFISAIPTIVK